MLSVPLVCLALAATLTPQSRMDSGIGEMTSERYHQSTFDAKRNLYLHSSND